MANSKLTEKQKAAQNPLSVFPSDCEEPRQYEDPAKRIVANLHVLTGFIKLMLCKDKYFDVSENHISADVGSCFDYLDEDEAHHLSYALMARKWKIEEDVRILAGK